MMAGGRNSNFGAADAYSLSASRGPTPRHSNYEEDKPRFHYQAPGGGAAGAAHYPVPNPGMFSPTGSKALGANANAKKPNGHPQQKSEDGGRDLPVFVWSSSASPVSDAFGGHHDYGATTDHKEVRLAVSQGKAEGHRENREDYMEREDLSFAKGGLNNQDGPAVMAAASIAVGLRGVLLRVAIVQAALPQGIVPFVFAKEYSLHPDILSTAVIFGMLIALPITLVYYILLGI
ncbi:hypothetical protein V6N11_014965 [Hibiscus sabdariffa]|uniref:Auxin efflux carrier component n=1 Tax=Hibiscus sabdariffa TaxID=183260 RepID=A0ABR2TQP1_9ROSI